MNGWCGGGNGEGDKGTLASIVITSAGGSLERHGTNHISVGAGSSGGVGVAGCGCQRTGEARERSTGGRAAINVVTQDAVGGGLPAKGHIAAGRSPAQCRGGRELILAQGGVAHEGDVNGPGEKIAL